MGNMVGCWAEGKRLMRAAREGDVEEARMLLELRPCLARYSTYFTGNNFPLHYAAAGGHTQIASLLLENGANPNARNYSGQTALMQACRYGCWEVVQTLLIFRANVTRSNYLNGRTALHFAAAEDHISCIRLLLADFIPSVKNVSDCDTLGSSSKHVYDNVELMKFVNKPADGGLTSLHMAALNGHFDCVQLLLDVNADVSAVTSHYGSMNLIGAGSTPLHYAACGGCLKCCQILVAKGANRQAVNCNGWLPVDVARIWGRHWLEPLLSADSKCTIPMFASSNYLSLPLMSILNIAREHVLQGSPSASDDDDLCAICLERSCNVAANDCCHELCVKCALHLCSTNSIKSDSTAPPGSIPCPMCRKGIISFAKKGNEM